jgi:dGTPase
VTQVVAVNELQLFHNRLTHTMKVAQLARRLAHDLVEDQQNGAALAARSLDPDAAEAAALAHDLGHPPFGHIAEEVLNEKCNEHGADGFEGNAQSFRIITKLARQGGEERGLGLHDVTLRGVLKYPWLRTEPDPTDATKLPEQHTTEEERHWMKWGAYKSEASRLQQLTGGDTEKTSEAAVMDWCDDISYALHDMEDFYRAGLIPLERLHQVDGGQGERDEFMGYVHHELGNKMADYDSHQMTEAMKELVGLFPDTAYKGTDTNRAEMHTRTSKLITTFFNAFTLHTTSRYARLERKNEYQVNLLKQLTWQYVVNGPALATVQQGQQRLIRTLFDDLMGWIQDETEHKSTHRLPRRLVQISDDLSRDNEALDSLPSYEARRARTVADFICSITEDQVFDLFRKVHGFGAATALEGWLTR